MEIREFKKGEVIIEKGEMTRDLFFLTEGLVEISTKEEDGEFVLNEIRPPQFFGDIAFFYGIPRTATAKAKTDVEVFVLKYDTLEYQVKDLPELLRPIFETLISRIKSRDDRNNELQIEIEELRRKLESGD